LEISFGDLLLVLISKKNREEMLWPELTSGPNIKNAGNSLFLVFII
jgi:hypothetical protein